jgi:hypothetical protein
MSSYELLELLEFMDNRGAFKTALRGGEYSDEELTERELFNEVARLRATMHAVQREQVEDAEAAAERREEVFSFADRTFGDDDDDRGAA